MIARAHAQDIGVVAMKTLKGARHRKLLESRSEADSYTQAAFKWVLSDPAVSCLVISMNEAVQVDEFLYASGKRFEPADLAVLLVGDPAKFEIDFPYLLAMISSSFISRRNTIVVPGGKMLLAMELILMPILKRMIEESRSTTRLVA